VLDGRRPADRRALGRCCAEIALVELDAGHRDDALRNGLLRLATERRLRPRRACRPDRTRSTLAATISPTSPAQPLRPQFSTATTRAAAIAEPATSATKIDVRDVGFAIPDELRQHGGERGLHHPQMTGDSIRTDQLRAGGGGLPHHFQGRAGKAATLARTASKSDSDAGRCARASASHSNWVS